MQLILDILFKEDEITWREVLMNLVKTNQIDPWDVDINVLTRKYISMLTKLKELDFRLSGKVILAAALLLRIKSDRLLEEDIQSFDQLIQAVDAEDVEAFYAEMEFSEPAEEEEREVPALVPRTPQLRKRRVSIYDLMDALESALEASAVRKSVVRERAAKVEVPIVKIDISELIAKVQAQLAQIFEKRASVPFTELAGSGSAEDRVLTFMPLLHLAHVDHRYVDLEQEENFGEIMIRPAEK